MLRLLGEVVAGEDGPEELGPPRQRCVLAALAVEAGQVVTVERLVQRVWGEDVPSRARETLHSYVSRLRRAPGIAIEHRSGGYTLTAEAVDLHVFRSLCADARQHESDAVRLLTEALDLWRGEALTGLDGEWAGAERGRLAREHLAARLDLVDARLRQEEGGELAVELAALAEEHPLDERVAGQLLRALAQSGRTADALEHYRVFRARLIDELGVEPGAALREEHRLLLTNDPVITTPTVVPKQLPAPPRPFVGREEELARLDAATAPSPGTVVISAIAGAGGIGKTWLALHWAHRHAARFPDGQLFVDLRGFAPECRPMDPAVAVRGFLDALGVERMPSDPHAQAALFRSLVADRKILLVLDNAAGSAQVTPLLPGGGSCTVVVTSRDRMPGLITGHNAQHVPLDVLPDAEARVLLTNRIGPERCAAEPRAVDRLITLCGGFPLALGVIAAHAHTRPHTGLADLADELEDLGLNAFDGGDPAASLPSVLSWSVRTLTPAQAKAFGLLAIAPGEDIGRKAATSLTGWTSAETRVALRGLEQASLISQDAHGRYRMHDLVRKHAANTPLCPKETDEALRRVVDFYLSSALAADRVLNPPRESVGIESPVDVPAPDDAMAWFDGEHRCVLAALHLAADSGRHRTAWNLVWALETYHRRRGMLRLRLEVWQIALAAVEHVPDHAVLTHRLLGRAYADLGRHKEAGDHLRQALDLAVRHEDRTNQVHIHRTLAAARAAGGDMRAAYWHAAEALRLCEGMGKPVWRARALNAVGWYAAHLGEHAEAHERCVAALELFERHEDPEGVATTLDSLGFITHGLGDHAQAVAHYEAALAGYDELGFTSDMADTYDRVGHAHLALGRPDRTRSAWRQAVELYAEQHRDEDAERVRRQLTELG